MPVLENKSNPKITPEKIRELSRLAKQLDGDPELRKEAEEMFRRTDKIRQLIDELKKIRLERGLSYSQMGELANIDAADLQHFENTRNVDPSLRTMLMYADALGVELNFHIEMPTATPSPK